MSERRGLDFVGKNMANRIVLNNISYHGKGAILSIVEEVKKRDFKKAFVCSDPR